MLNFLMRNPWFYDQLHLLSLKVHDAAKLAHRLAEDFTSLAAVSADLQKLEDEGDDITRRFVAKVDETFVTPMDKEDLEKLCNKIDIVIDSIRGTVLRIELYRLESPHREFALLADSLVKATAPLAEMIKCLSVGKKLRQQAMELGQQVIAAEKDADLIFRNAIANLLDGEGMDALTVVKWKEVLEGLEEAIDRVNAAAKFIDRLVLKYA